MGKKVTVAISGMTCTGCEKTVSNFFLQTGKVKSAKANYKTKQAEIEVDNDKDPNEVVDNFNRLTFGAYTANLLKD